MAFGKHLDKVRYTHSTTNRGTADIHAIVKGRHVSIEIKIGRDKLSDHQLKEQVRVINAGGLYFIARDMESFVMWYRETFENDIS